MGGGAIFGDREAGDIEKERRRLILINFIGRFYIYFLVSESVLGVWFIQGIFL